MSLRVRTLELTTFAAALLAAVGLASAQTTTTTAVTINLTAQQATAALADGSTVPMWAYCGALQTGSAGAVVGGACPATGLWSPGPTIVVPVGDSLTINLTNALPVTTSLTIVGQYGGTDLGKPDRVASPAHAPDTMTTWNNNVVAPTPFTPPKQGTRARSFGPEAAANGGTQQYTWAAGVLRPGTYLYETGSHVSLQAPMGLYGVLIVTQAPVTGVTAPTPPATNPVTTITTPGHAYPGVPGPPGSNIYSVANAGVPYDADATFLLSEIDAEQNIAVDAAARAGTAEDLVSSDPSCVQAQKGGTVHCYPPAVNYRPTYFLINGSSFNPANPSATTSVVADGALTGNVLVRFVNAGLRTHVPAITGLQMAVLSEDGNLAPGLPKVQSEVNLTPGRSADVIINLASNGTLAGSTTAAVAPTAYIDQAYPVFDRALALAGGNLPNAGMHGFLAVAPSGTGATSAATNAYLASASGGVSTATANAANYTFTLPPNVLPKFSASVATNSVGLTSITTGTAPAHGTVAWGSSGSFTYTPTTGPINQGDTFTYCSPGTPAPVCGTVTLSLASEAATLTAPNTSFTSTVSTLYRTLTRAAGVLAGVAASDGYLPIAALSGAPTGCTVTLNSDGSFSAAPSVRTGATCAFSYTVTDPRKPASAVTAKATVNFPAPTNLAVTVADALSGAVLPGTTGTSDYTWIIEEDDTFHISTPGVTPVFAPGSVPPPSLATSFHRSHMPVVAVGCTGPLSCGDGKGGQTIQGVAAPAATYSTPADAVLDPTKHYYISILPGDAANPFVNGFVGDPTVTPTCLTSKATATSPAPTDCGHTMGGAPIAPGQVTAKVTVEPNPLKPAALSIFIFEDNSPTNNDYDANEVGLGGFEIIVNDVAGRSGDPVGQVTYDAFNMPLTNSLLGVAGCPNETPAGTAALQQTNLVGVVYTCPDGDRRISSVTVGQAVITVTTAVAHQFGQSAQGTNPTVDISGLGTAALNGSFAVTVTGPNTFTFANPGVRAGTSVLVVPSSMARDATTYQLAGQALINNIMPGRYDVIAHPSAAREGAGETWYQVSTLEGTPGQDAFTKASEPNYFQEFGPPGFHTFIGWINPAHLDDQNKLAVAQASAAGVSGTTVISGRVTSLHMSRTVMETLWDSASNAAIAQSTCFVALNQTGETGNDVAFTACNPDGSFTLPAVPSGQQYELVVWDRWLDQIVAFKNLAANAVTAGNVALGDIPVFSWFTRVETSVYYDANGNGVKDPGEQGIALVPVKIHFRDGSISNVLTTDGTGTAVFNELFPLFNWYVIESDKVRYASTGVNITVDAGGLPDCIDYNAATGQGSINMSNGTCPQGTATNPGTTTAMALGQRTAGVANSSYVWTDPTTGLSYGAVPPGAATSTNRVDPGTTQFNGMYEGLQSFINQTEMLDYGRRNFNPGENGGIQGMVVYSSTRGFDDPSLQLQNLWEPGIPRVTINLYREQLNADGTTGYVYVNTTLSTSWDDWANLVKGSDGNNYILGADNVLRSSTTGLAAPPGVSAGPQVNLTCPGQDSNDPFLAYSIGAAQQFKCYDGFHMWNQVQPAVFDGAYLFTTDSSGKPLTPGTYVVEVVPPPGYELVKEEDKNILIGDQWVTPPAQQFGAITNLFILPDQAALANAYNANNPGNNNTTLSEGFTQANQLYPKCVGQPHQVPDYMSLFPISGQVAPFAGAVKNLCDRKEVTLNDQMTAIANFFLFTKTPRASHFTGLMLDDAAAEINAAAPDFGEKFAASYAPVSLKDFNGVEVSRVYTDQWGTYNGVIYSTWQVNVPNPAGYSPNMLVTCMNDPGPIPGPNGTLITDPLYNPSYSNFCYTNPFMPGLTVYLDTPILPVAAFAAGYNPPDCALPATTPAILRVDGDSKGPWVAAADGTHTLTIVAQGDVQVPNANYQGPSGTTAPWNARTITRHYGFGASQGGGAVSVNGTRLTITSWSDATITATVPAGTSSGELSIVAGNGMKSVDAVTVTIGGAAPQVVEPAPNATNLAGNAHPIQDAIDAASPGDLIIVDAGTYPELVVMWKPVRLQGVGAASVIINAAKYPTQKLQNWRPLINKYFGVDTVAGNQVPNSQVDALPNQEITGGIVLLEPTVLATEEGAGITVLAKDPDATDAAGKLIANCGNPATSSYPDQVLFPPTSNKVNIIASSARMSDSNFNCAPSRIDGISVTGSDSGGGIYVNGWANGLEIANNRVYGNAGSFNGGIRVGVPYLEGLTHTAAAADGTVFGYDKHVHIHHNQITNNGTVEANPGTVNAANSTGAGGGLSICTGTDNYRVDFNFICGNFSAGDGGGIGHIGVSNRGVIAENTIIFNQSYQQTAQVNGGGIVVEGELAAAGGLSLGTGSLTIDRNLIRGNFAQAGHGGGIRLQQVNGADVAANPNNLSGRGLQPWYHVTITNNMIDNNVSGWGGGGFSAADALSVDLSNDTISGNDSVGIVGTMIGTDPLATGTPLRNTTGYPSPAGISVDKTTAVLLTGMTAANQTASRYSNPSMYNDIVWHNRSFYFAITQQPNAQNIVVPTNTLCPSNSVADAYSLACTPLPPQTSIGQCVGNPAYWDLGTTDDSSATAGSDAAHFQLQPTYAVLSNTGGYAGTGNTASDPLLVKTYCNGARANPAFIFEPGQPFLDPAAQNLTAGATLDEAGNYVDVRFGPLYLYDPTTSTTTSPGLFVGDYHLTGPSGAAYNVGGSIAGRAATLTLDFDGDRRPQDRGGGSGVDIGADEYVSSQSRVAATFNSPIAFGDVALRSTTAAQIITLTNVGSDPLSINAGNIALTGANAGQFALAGTTCTAAPVPVGGMCTISVTFTPTSSGPKTARVNVTANGGVLTTGGLVALTGTGVAPVLVLSDPNGTKSGTYNYGTGTTTRTATFTLSNSGATALAISGINAVSSGGPGTYTITGGSCSTGGMVAANGGSCTIDVRFVPGAARTTNAQLRVTGTASGTTAPTYLIARTLSGS